MVDYNVDLVQRFERAKELRKQWNISIMACLLNKVINLKDLDSYRKDYKKGKAYQKYIKRNVGHNEDL